MTAVGRLRAAATAVVAADRPRTDVDPLDGHAERAFEDEAAMWAYFDAARDNAGALALAVLALLDKVDAKDTLLSAYRLGSRRYAGQALDASEKADKALAAAADVLPEEEPRD